MRFSGVALVFLAIGHLFIMLMWDNGVLPDRLQLRRAALGFAVLAILDLALLWLRNCTAATACAPSSTTTAAKTAPFWLNSLLLLSMGFTLVLGTYVLVTFDPNIGG